MSNTSADTPEKPLNFIRQIIAEELKSGKHSDIVTRFPLRTQRFSPHRTRVI